MYQPIDDQSITTQKSPLLPVRLSALIGSSGDKIGKTNSVPVFSTHRIYPIAGVLKLPTYPSLPFCIIMSMQEVREEALLNITCIIILKQLKLLLLAISLFAKGQLLLPEFFCEGTMPSLSDF